MDKDPGLKVLSSDERITVQEYSNSVSNENHLLIDVRSREEFEICRLENSVNVPIKNVLDNKIDVEIMNRIEDEKTPGEFFF